MSVVKFSIEERLAMAIACAILEKEGRVSPVTAACILSVFNLGQTNDWFGVRSAVDVTVPGGKVHVVFFLDKTKPSDVLGGWRLEELRFKYRDLDVKEFQALCASIPQSMT